MYDIKKFTLGKMTKCGAVLRKLGADEMSMETTAHRIVNYFYDHFVDFETGESALALVRFFKTHSYEKLPSELQKTAARILGYTPTQPDLKCLTLLATAGDLPTWNSRTESVGHQTIPLPSEQVVNQVPMIAQLIKQLGLVVRNVISPDPSLIVDFQERTYNVFHILEAQGSPYIPAQEEFILPFKIQSVLGFGGILPSGNLMAIILFSKLPIERETAELFKPLALNAKMAVLPFDQSSIFKADNN